mgnify:CR=1 FL=1
MVMDSRFIIVALSLVLLSGCGDENATSNNGQDSSNTPQDAGTENSSISCANACKRQPLCTPDLVTEQDCLAVCNAEEDPTLYACCIQSAKTCAGVEQCTNKSNLVCDETAELWIPIGILEECQCGDQESIAANKECKATGPDHRCETGVCLKPVNYARAPFCTIDCGTAPDQCPASMKCQDTPKTDYCNY